MRWHISLSAGVIGKGGVGNAFRFTPPLVVQNEHVDRALDILDASIAAVMEKFSL